MPRTQKLLAPGEPRGEIVDTLLLKFDDRRKQQGFAFGAKGTCVEFDFAQAPLLRTDDLLVLDDGRLVEVVADAEPLLEVRSKDFAAFARLVLTLGNRHVPVQILANRIRMLRTPENEALLAERGAEGVAVMAPFDPHDDAHRHGHDHEHDDGHHDHLGHERHHEHDHDHAHDDHRDHHK
jgi:urease accessory protein